MFPAARVSDLSVTGDNVMPPGVPTVLISGLPAAVIGDVVTGNACTGAIAMGSMTVLIGHRPAARVTSQIMGVNPYTGVPVTSIIAPPGAATS